jgi:hypothetical protein
MSMLPKGTKRGKLQELSTITATRRAAERMIILDFFIKNPSLIIEHVTE